MKHLFVRSSNFMYHSSSLSNSFSYCTFNKSLQVSSKNRTSSSTRLRVVYDCFIFLVLFFAGFLNSVRKCRCRSTPGNARIDIQLSRECTSSGSTACIGWIWQTNFIEATQEKRNLNTISSSLIIIGFFLAYIEKKLKGSHPFLDQLCLYLL